MRGGRPMNNPGQKHYLIFIRCRDLKYEYAIDVSMHLFSLEIVLFLYTWAYLYICMLIHVYDINVSDGEAKWQAISSGISLKFITEAWLQVSFWCCITSINALYVINCTFQSFASHKASLLLLFICMKIVECRRVLKWTYAYGYYLPEEDIAKKRFFEYLQG